MSDSSSSGWGCLALVLVFVLFMVGVWGCNKATEKNVSLTVNRLDDQASSKGHTYLVFTDKGVFKDKDNIFYLKFNSSDLFAKLQEHHRYNCKTNGFRIPLFSSYKNLIDCKPAP